MSRSPLGSPYGVPSRPPVCRPSLRSLLALFGMRRDSKTFPAPLGPGILLFVAHTVGQSRRTVRAARRAASECPRRVAQPPLSAQGQGLRQRCALPCANGPSALPAVPLWVASRACRASGPGSRILAALLRPRGAFAPFRRSGWRNPRPPGERTRSKNAPSCPPPGEVRKAKKGQPGKSPPPLLFLSPNQV